MGCRICANASIWSTGLFFYSKLWLKYLKSCNNLNLKGNESIYLTAKFIYLILTFKVFSCFGFHVYYLSLRFCTIPADYWKQLKAIGQNTSTNYFNYRYGCNKCNNWLQPPATLREIEINTACLPSWITLLTSDWYSVQFYTKLMVSAD